MARDAKKVAAAIAALAPGMDKKLLVAAIVQIELEAAGHPPPMDVTKVMGADYQFDIAGMKGFLLAVQFDLTTYKPPYQFNFSGAFPDAALKLQVGALIGEINKRTKLAETAAK